MDIMMGGMGVEILQYLAMLAGLRVHDRYHIHLLGCHFALSRNDLEN
jgi:hypothetical protein